jgi:hypothetical protein
MSGIGEISGRKGGVSLGTLSPDPWDLSLLMPIPVDVFFNLNTWGPAYSEPQSGLGPGVGA